MACVKLDLSVCICIFVYLCIFVFVHLCVYRNENGLPETKLDLTVCICIFVYLYICVFVYLCVYRNENGLPETKLDLTVCICSEKRSRFVICEVKQKQITSHICKPNKYICKYPLHTHPKFFIYIHNMF